MGGDLIGMRLAHNSEPQVRDCEGQADANVRGHDRRDIGLSFR